LVPEHSMHFCRCGHAEIAALFSIIPSPFALSGSGESSKLSSERAYLPCGLGFPQTLLTCRRPVLPPPTGRRCFCLPDLVTPVVLVAVLMLQWGLRPPSNASDEP